VRSRDRDQLRRELAESGIETDIHYPVPPHRQPAYIDLSKDFGPLPVADLLSSEVMSLPLNPALEDRQVERVLSKLQVAAR
jgi:dTDP-4-amino-4,6-dideoxygalactose transaminase